MVFRCSCALLAFGLAWGLLGPASARAADWPLLPGGTYDQRHPAYQPGNPKCQVGCATAQQPATYGQYPWYGYQWGVPTYNWGYFGSHARPSTYCYKTYYRDCLQWGQWRRY